jgi:hypothetical protein
MVSALAGVVDQDIDAAETAERCIHNSGARFRIRQIAPGNQSALALDRSSGGEGQVRGSASKRAGACRPNSAGRAGDQNHFPGDEQADSQFSVDLGSHGFREAGLCRCLLDLRVRWAVEGREFRGRRC